MAAALVATLPSLPAEVLVVVVRAFSRKTGVQISPSVLACLMPLINLSISKVRPQGGPGDGLVAVAVLAPAAAAGVGPTIVGWPFSPWWGLAVAVILRVLLGTAGAVRTPPTGLASR